MQQRKWNFGESRIMSERSETLGEREKKERGVRVCCIAIERVV